MRAVKIENIRSGRLIIVDCSWNPKARRECLPLFERYFTELLTRREGLVKCVAADKPEEAIEFVFGVYRKQEPLGALVLYAASMSRSGGDWEIQGFPAPGLPNANLVSKVLGALVTQGLQEIAPRARTIDVVLEFPTKRAEERWDAVTDSMLGDLVDETREEEDGVLKKIRRKRASL